MAIYGNDLTDLQQGKLLEKEQDNQSAADNRNFLSTLSGQRSNERVATKQLDKQDRQYYTGLEQQDRQANEERALRRFAAETGNQQFLAELDLKKSISKAEQGYREVTGKAQLMGSLAQIMAAMRSGITSGNRSSAISTYGALARDAAKRFGDHQARVSQLEADVNSVNQALREGAAGNVDVSWWPKDRTPSEAGKKVFSDADASGPTAWLEQIKPSLGGKVEWDGLANGGVGEFRLIPSREEAQFKAEYQELRSVLDSLRSGNEVNDVEIGATAEALDSIAAKFGIKMSDYMPASTGPSPIPRTSLSPRTAPPDSGGYIPSEAGPASKRQSNPAVKEGSIIKNQAGKRMILKNGTWQPL